MHGVLNVLVFTTFFICGFLPFIAPGLRVPLASPRLGWVTFWLMVAGLVLAAIPLVGNAATVMFTFYPPLKAHWAFYVGLTLVVVGTWLVTLESRAHMARRGARGIQGDGRRWRRSCRSSPSRCGRSRRSGLAAEMLLLLIPWSLGLVGGTDPLLARTLFWFTGHPIVYFWLLPAYVSWYTLVPRQAGGKLFSDPMARTSFMLFLILSTPIGIHHQYADPGIHQGWKLLHAFLTFAVFFPSLLTFFNVIASLETAGRARGGTGLDQLVRRSCRGTIRRWPRRCSPWCSSRSAASAA